MQKPIARPARAWWPGGRTSAKPPRSTASSATPAASTAASQEVSVAIVSLSKRSGRSIAAQERQVVGGVHALELVVRRPPLDGRAAEPEQPLLPLGVVSRRMQVRERRIGQELDSASSRPVSRPSPQSPASAAARLHVGS